MRRGLARARIGLGGKAPQHIGALERRPQRLVGNMGVDFGGRDAGMAKQPLHEPDIDAALDQNVAAVCLSICGVMRRAAPVLVE